MSAPELSPDLKVVEALSRTHRAALLRYFQRKGFRPPSDEDAVQELMICLARREGLASEVDKLENYMFTAAAHVASDLQRKARARAEGRHDLYDEAQHAPLDHDPEEILRGRQALDAMVVALQELPERTRTIFVLTRLEHMRQAEVAKRLGVALNTVEKHLHKAVSYLSTQVGRRS